MALWLSGQQKRLARRGEGQTGIVTMAGENLTVRLDSEMGVADIYGPAGYRWTPQAGDRVLVIKGEGEKPCVAGVRQGGVPRSVTLQAETVKLQGEILINEKPLDDHVRELVRQVLEELD